MRGTLGIDEEMRRKLVQLAVGIGVFALLLFLSPVTKRMRGGSLRRKNRRSERAERNR